MKGSRAVLRRICALTLVASALPIASVARAADLSEGAVAAESLFQEARQLADRKRYAEACPKFLASYKLSPAVGTLLNLADCYEKAGQYASAWARFHEAIAMAQQLGQSNRERTARDRAEKIESKLTRITITSREPRATVKLDGHDLESAAFGAAIPIDPGKHTVEASAKGKKPFVTTVDVRDRDRALSLEIPFLEDENVVAEKIAPEEPRRVVDWNRDAGHTQRTIGVVAASVGAVGIGAGAFFGVRTSSKWSQAKTHCSGLECDQEGVDLARAAKNNATISTAACIAGGALLAGGLIVYITAPRNRSSGATDPARVRLGVGPGSIVAAGAF
ncbi:MAG: hypothetical protein FWD69_07925 [Polyangiaceae bacterium]|nr:hypothetical protein [Polyangiaceae bacterium]